MERLTEEKQIGPFASLKDKAEAVPGAFGTYGCLFSHMIAVTKLKRYEDTGLEPEEIMARIDPPNKPLTLDELWEMDGEPVWVTHLNRWKVCYGLSDVRGFLCMETGDGGFINMVSYGKWLAYRRKPEEGTQKLSGKAAVNEQL